MELIKKCPNGYAHPGVNCSYLQLQLLQSWTSPIQGSSLSRWWHARGRSKLNKDKWIMMKILCYVAVLTSRLGNQNTRGFQMCCVSFCKFLFPAWIHQRIMHPRPLHLEVNQFLVAGVRESNQQLPVARKPCSMTQRHLKPQSFWLPASGFARFAHEKTKAHWQRVAEMKQLEGYRWKSGDDSWHQLGTSCSHKSLYGPTIKTLTAEWFTKFDRLVPCMRIDFIWFHAQFLNFG
jgi:hypothetical protein